MLGFQNPRQTFEGLDTKEGEESQQETGKFRSHIDVVSENGSRRGLWLCSSILWLFIDPIPGFGGSIGYVMLFIYNVRFTGQEAIYLDALYFE